MNKMVLAQNDDANADDDSVSCNNAGPIPASSEPVSHEWYREKVLFSSVERTPLVSPFDRRNIFNCLPASKFDRLQWNGTIRPKRSDIKCGICGDKYMYAIRINTILELAPNSVIVY